MCPCAVIMAAMRFCAMCLRIMLLSLMLPLLPLRRRVRLPLRQADWELRLLRRWRVMLCRRRWCDSSLLMRSCILIRRCIGVRSINYRLRRRGFWSFSEILTKRKKTPTFFRTRALFFAFILLVLLRLHSQRISVHLLRQQELQPLRQRRQREQQLFPHPQQIVVLIAAFLLR